MNSEKVNLDNFDIEQIVAFEGYEYRLSNGNSGLQLNVKTCPSCHRDDYKVYLNAETGYGNCFGCGIGYNKYKFVKLSRGLAVHKEVMRYFESMGNYVSYRPRPTPVSSRELNKDWVLPQNYLIELEDQVPAYLKDRGVDAKLCKRFDLRVCEYGFYHYTDFHDKERAVDFSQRIIIPVKDYEGNLVTFQGRDITGKAEKKYLFPNMLPGTARYIYNADYAIRNKAKRVVLNEGAFDVFATTKALESDLKYNGYVACGTFGKHLSMAKTNVQVEDQLSDLMRLKQAGVEEFIILWDGERKAILAALESVIRLNNFGFNATLATLSGGFDPAEVSPEVLLKAIDDRRYPTTLEIIRMKLSNECS
jgi:DNA primase